MTEPSASLSRPVVTDLLRPPSSSARSSRTTSSSRSASAMSASSHSTSRRRSAVAEQHRTLEPPKPIETPTMCWERPWSDGIRDTGPSAGIYSSMAPVHGNPPPALKAHTATLVGDRIFFIGGSLAPSQGGGCFRGVATFNIHTMRWEQITGIEGQAPPPLRAHTAVAVGESIYIFGGGDGLDYYADMYELDTVALRWTLIVPNTPPKRCPPRRRAHSAALLPPSNTKILIMGGGNGDRALNDTWAFDTVTREWEEILVAPGAATPSDRGYHSGTCVDGKLVVYGGSDGTKSFSSLDALDLKSRMWHQLNRPSISSRSNGAPKSRAYPRAFHTATLVGRELWIIGGHDGARYPSEVLCYDFRRHKWTTKPVAGKLPPERGYHTTTLADGRLWIYGGSDGGSFFGDMWSLDLGASAALPLLGPVLIDLEDREVAGRL